MTEITKEAALANLPHIMKWLDDALESIGCPNKAHMQIDVAADEILGNIVSYAYPDKAGNVTVKFEHQDDPGLLSLTFIDQGVPFDPLTVADPDTTLGPEERGIGGLGIFLIKKMMDNVSYEYKDGSNVLSISKSLAE
ncbi:MAG: ATP-binding protein [Firmicutes bacterium]|nr:ATP-binding protein [Bacillota bacterium]